MNCMDTRRRMLADPNDRDPDYRAHLNACPGCRREQQRLRALDQRLAEALRVPVPEGLEARLRVARGVQRKRERRQRWLGGLALAASLLVMAVLLYRPGGAPGILPEVPIAHQVVLHILHEHEALEAQGPVPEERVERLLEEFHLHLAGHLDGVTYARRCPMGHEDGVHLVVRGKKGPVTVLVMPGERVRRPQPVDSRNLEGLIVPTGFGSIAVVGSPAEPIGPILDRVRRLVRPLDDTRTG